MAPTYYEILEVPPTASKAEIKKAYRKLQNEWHTDKLKGMKAQAEQNGASADDLKRFDLMFEVAEAKLKDFNEAYEVLSDDDKRARYDDSLKARASSTTPPAPVPPSIMITPNRLDFGKLKSGTGRYFHTFVISNAGGPVVGDSSLDFGMNTDWAEMQYEATDKTIFPITVKVLVDTNAISSGKHETVVVFEAGSEVFEIPVIVEIEAVVISTPPPSPRPSTGATSSASSSAASKPSSASHAPTSKYSPRSGGTYRGLERWRNRAIAVLVSVVLTLSMGMYLKHPWEGLLDWDIVRFVRGFLTVERTYIVDNYSQAVWSADSKYVAVETNYVQQIDLVHSGDNTRSISLSNTVIRVLDADGRLMTEFTTENNKSVTMQMSPDASYLAVVFHQRGNNGSLQLVARTVNLVTLQTQEEILNLSIDFDAESAFFSPSWAEDSHAYLIAQISATSRGLVGNSIVMELNSQEVFTQGTSLTRQTLLQRFPQASSVIYETGYRWLGASIPDATRLFPSPNGQRLVYVSMANITYFCKA